jgi:hypothetical protein
MSWCWRSGADASTRTAKKPCTMNSLVGFRRAIDAEEEESTHV